MVTPRSSHALPDALAGTLAAAFDRLMRARRLQRQQIATQHRLSPLQVDLLTMVSQGSPPEPTVGALATELGVSQPTATESLRTLERKGLVERRRADDDRRRRSVHLTSVGTRLAHALEAADRQLVSALSSLDSSTQETVLHALLSVIAGLVDAGAITVARTCLTCRFHRSDAHGAHHCTLLARDLAPGELRVDCAEHEPLVGLR